MKLINSAVAVGIASDGSTLLAGGTTTIASWGQGNAYHGTNPTGTYTQGPIASANKPPMLLDSSGKIFGRTHPQYADYAPSQFVSVRDNGAMGDGITDDTAAIKDVFAKVNLNCLLSARNNAHAHSHIFPIKSLQDARSSSSTRELTSYPRLSPFRQEAKSSEKPGLQLLERALLSRANLTPPPSFRSAV